MATLLTIIGTTLVIFYGILTLTFYGKISKIAADILKNLSGKRQ